ncbi:hypothetical protein SS05631_c06570 [Sinorhizobium sp. CCBAU 05631]|nr:hypothetical protein SS05631_c06570 [Sinorhizobium sp. CCBAU 05631]
MGFRDIKAECAESPTKNDPSDRYLVERDIATCRSPPLWGRCPAGQRGVSHERITRMSPSR